LQGTTNERKSSLGGIVKSEESLDVGFRIPASRENGGFESESLANKSEKERRSVESLVINPKCKPVSKRSFLR